MVRAARCSVSSSSLAQTKASQRADELELLLECLGAASRDNWSRVLECLCRAASLAASSPCAAVFVWLTSSPRCLAAFRVDPPRVEEFARRLGRVAQTSPAHQLGPYQVFSLPVAGSLSAGLLLEPSVPLVPEQQIAGILETLTSVLNRKLREAEQQRARCDTLSGAVEQQRTLIDSEFNQEPDGLALVDVDHLLRSAVERAAGPAAARGIGLCMDASRHPVWARANRSELELLFRQLLRIAVREARRGSRISARLGATGEWISAELRSEVPWQSQVAEFHICQEVVRRHRGQLFVKEGRDVLVEIHLPRERDIDRWQQLGRQPRLPVEAARIRVQSPA